MGKFDLLKPVNPCTCSHAHLDHNLIYVTAIRKEYAGMCHYCECENYVAV